jgi:ABC-type Co2+ transport system permease subunit
MMGTPWGPSAVPTGGAGVALPAGIWILMIAATFFFAMCVLIFLDGGMRCGEADVLRQSFAT